MAAEDSLAHRNHQLLQQILEQLQQLNDTLNSFTAEGLPLRAQVPGPDVIASVMAAAALVGKERPQINAEDLQQRLAAAQTLAEMFLRHHDAYRTGSQLDRLNQLLPS